jgi:hypothetical protein
LLHSVKFDQLKTLAVSIASAEELETSLYQSCPRMHSDKGGIDHLQLHVECFRQCRSSVISQYLQQYPKSLSFPDIERYLPLHRLLENNSSTVDDALLMIRKYPAALQHPNNNGDLPLHIESRNQYRSSVISKSIDLYPEALSLANNDDNLPLHELLGSQSQIEQAMLLISKYPAGVKHQNCHGHLPLHIECYVQRRSTIIWKCIELYPESFGVVDGDGCLPLHRLLNESSTGNVCSIIDALRMIEKYPAALQHQNHDGQLPIHIEFSLLCRPSIVSKCMELNSGSLAVVDGEGSLPLHSLLENKLLSIDMSEILMTMEKYPAALKHQNDSGSLPLHIECKYQCRSSVILKCIELYPEALCVVDGQGFMPLHWLLHRTFTCNNSTVDLMLTIIEKYPAAVEHQNRDGNLPIHIECSFRCRSEVVCRCLSLYPQSAEMINQNGETPLAAAFNKILRGPANTYSYLPALSLLVKLNPVSFTKLLMNTPHLNIRNFLTRRILWNLAADDTALSPEYLLDKHNLNWKPRSRLICLLLQPQLRRRVKNIQRSKILLYEVIRRSSLIDGDMQGYAICQGNEVGDHLLRHVISYL